METPWATGEGTAGAPICGPLRNEREQGKVIAGSLSPAVGELPACDREPRRSGGWNGPFLAGVSIQYEVCETQVHFEALSAKPPSLSP